MSTTSSSLHTVKTFHPFPNFPTELRLKIWRLTLLSPPRLIPFFHNSFTESFILVRGLSPRIGYDWSTSMSSIIPSALRSVPFACREAYAVFMSSAVMPLEHSISTTRTLTTPYHPAQDVVLFSQRVEPGTISAFVHRFPLPATKTRRLAISALSSPVKVLLELKDMKNLETLYLVWHELSPTTRETWNDVWAEGLERPYDTKWEFQEALTKVLDRFREEWPKWRVPTVKLIGHWEEILKD